MEFSIGIPTTTVNIYHDLCLVGCLCGKLLVCVVSCWFANSAVWNKRTKRSAYCVCCFNKCVQLFTFMLLCGAVKIILLFQLNTFKLLNSFYSKEL